MKGFIICQSKYLIFSKLKLRQNQDIIFILHVLCVNVQNFLIIHRLLPFPIPSPKQMTHHDMTIKQSILASELSVIELANIFDQHDLDFKPEEITLSIIDEQEMIGKNNEFQIISQVKLTGCLQRNHMYLCDKHQVVRTDLEDTCLGALYLKSELGVQKHCKFETRPAYQISVTDHLVFSTIPKVHKMASKQLST
jgi:hypothetical protein